MSSPIMRWFPLVLTVLYCFQYLAASEGGMHLAVKWG